MEELKLLVEMVSNLPSMALWVIAFFFAYKVIVVGSIYGVIKFVAQKIYESIVEKRKPLPAQEIKYKFAGKFIDEDVRHAFDAQVIRLHQGRYSNIHMDDVKSLSMLIDQKIELEKRK